MRDWARVRLRRLLDESPRRASAYQIARVFAALGDRDEALQWLEKAYEERAFHVFFLGVDPSFDDLRSEERFHDLMRRIGLAS